MIHSAESQMLPKEKYNIVSDAFLEVYPKLYNIRKTKMLPKYLIFDIQLCILYHRFYHFQFNR